jgi:menaquinone-dependent protoporphyrinogen oxidase
VEFRQLNCGEKTKMDKILVTYASRCGSTGEVAEAIGQTLCGNGAAVEVRPLKDVTDLSAYRAVVVGSAIRMGGWLSEATNFVKKNREVLSGLPVAYFSVGMVLQEDTPEKRREAEDYLAPVRQILEPKSLGLFAGKMDYSKLSWLDRFIITKMAKTPEGDFRNWEAIRAWAAEIRPALIS